MASKVQYNVGTFKGLNGTANIYTVLSSGGILFLAHKATVGGVDKWVYTARTAMQAYIAGGDGTISSNIDLTKIADTAPTGILDGDGYVIIDNGDTVPRLFNSNALYSLRGEGIAEYTGDVGTPVGRESGGANVTITSNAKTLSESLTEAVTWVTKNPIILVLVGFLLLELLGVTHVLGIRKKKRVAARRR